MTTKMLLSTQFSKLAAAIKDFINMGECFLYEISYYSLPAARYCLFTDRITFFLSSNGAVVKTFSITPQGLTFLSRITFSDFYRSILHAAHISL
ncbi:MAG: hypothetical protein ACTTKL_06570 [Treponema sp.]